ncbi:MAG: outer membrane beta-barrel protein [Candidatus Limimorpha sp.]
MRKLLLSLSLIITLVANAFAQDGNHYGIYIGAGINNMRIDSRMFVDDSQPYTINDITITADSNIINKTSVAYLPIENAKMRVNAGFVLGGYYEYMVSDMLGLKFDLLYNGNGYSLKGDITKKDIIDTTQFYVYNYSSTTKASNISASVMASLHFLKDRMTVELGVQPSYCIQIIKEAEWTLNKSRINKSTIYEKTKEYNPFNFAIVGGVSGSITEHLFVSARYCFGMVDIFKSKTPYLSDEGNIKYLYDEAKSKTNSLLITLGYKIK